tara:strand:+ start:159 stop:1061 length:903 start_codon:yes stop_codon:yes gene_type:complete
MSTVRMSVNLKSTILNNYKDAYKKTNTSLQNVDRYENIPKFSAHLGDALYDKYMVPIITTTKEYVDKPCFTNVALKNKTDPEGGCIRSGVNYPNEFFSMGNKLRVSMPLTSYSYQYLDTESTDHLMNVNGSSVATEWKAIRPAEAVQYSKDKTKLSLLETKRRDIKIYLTKECLMAGLVDRYNDAQTIKLHFTSDEVAKSLHLSTIQDEYAAYSKATLTMEFDRLKLHNLLEQFTTLNQALKAWPAISKLVPSEAMYKVNEKQERKRKQQKLKLAADETLDAADLNNTLLTASLLGDTNV